MIIYKTITIDTYTHTHTHKKKQITYRDPGLGEEGARAEHKDNVDKQLDGIRHGVLQRGRRLQVVAQAPHRVRLVLKGKKREKEQRLEERKRERKEKN